MKIKLKDKSNNLNQEESCEGALVVTHHGNAICCKTVGKFDDQIAAEYLDTILDGAIPSLLNCFTPDALAAYLMQRRATVTTPTQEEQKSRAQSYGVSTPGGLDVILSSIVNDIIRKGGQHHG